jgi:hypothetical protein
MIAIYKDGKKIKEVHSAKEASRETGLFYSTVIQAIYDGRVVKGGYEFLADEFYGSSKATPYEVTFVDRETKKPETRVCFGIKDICMFTGYNAGYILRRLNKSTKYLSIKKA